MPFSYQSHPILASDTYAVIAQVTHHLQKARPSLPPTTVLRMAEGFELHIRARAISRQDYINRVNAGLIILLQSARSASLPNLMPDPTTRQPLGAPVTLQVNNQPISSQYHNTVPPPAPITGNRQIPYSALEHTMFSNVDCTPVSIPTANVPIGANVDLSVHELNLDLVTTPPSNDPQMDAYTASTHVSPITGEPGLRIPYVGPIRGQQDCIVETAAVANLPEDSSHKAIEDDGPCHEQVNEEKEPRSPLHQEEPKSTVRVKRRTSRTRAQQRRKESPAVSDTLPVTPPATRSRARKTNKRSTRKRSTRGRKRAIKQPDNTEPPTDGNDISNFLPGNTQDGPNCSRFENSEAPTILRGSLDAEAGHELTSKGSGEFEIGTGKSPQTPPTQRSQLQPSSVSGVPTPMGNFSTQIASEPPISLVPESPCNYAGSNGGSSLPNSMQIPTEGGSSQPTTLSDPSHIQSSYHSFANTQMGLGTGENVLFCSNGEVEIDSGIRVPKERIIIAAASLGIILTTSQLQYMKKAHALMILVKANQQEMVQTNGVMRFLGSNPALAQPSPEDERRSQFHPQMMGKLHSRRDHPSTHSGIAQPSPQPPNRTELPFNSNERSSQLEACLAEFPELNTRRVPQTTQPSIPRWRCNVPEVQARLRKFQMDYRKYLSLLQQEVFGIRARTSDNFLRYLRCCINLLAMNPMQVRGVSVEVIDSIERFVRNFLNQQKKSGSKSGQSSQPIRINTHGATDEAPENELDKADFGPSAFQNAVRLDGQPTKQDVSRSGFQGATNLVPIYSDPSENVCLRSEMERGVHGNGATGTTNYGQVNGSKYQADIRKDVGVDGEISCKKSELPKTNGRKRKSCGNLEGGRSGKRVSKVRENGANDGMKDRNDAEDESGSKINPGEVIDITDKTCPGLGVGVYCQRDTKGNMFNFVRVSDGPDLEEMIQRLRFMLNCGMKVTTCYISVSEGREEDNSRRIEDVLISLEPKKQSLNEDSGHNKDECTGKRICFMDLINAECKEARKRYGYVTVEMLEEFKRPVFRGILRYNEREFPKLELRVTGNRKGEMERGFERPPMGWIGVLEEVRNVVCGSVENGCGIERMIDGWLRMKNRR